MTVRAHGDLLVIIISSAKRITYRGTGDPTFRVGGDGAQDTSSGV